MEEPLYILEKMKKSQEQQQQLSNSNSDIEMAEDDDDDSFWQSAAEVLDKSVTAATTTVEKDVDMDDMVDTETPRFESLSVKDDTPTTPPETASRPLKRKRVGEDVFTRDAVKQWQGSRIKAWENRYMVNIYFFAFFSACAIICVYIIYFLLLFTNFIVKHYLSRALKVFIIDLLLQVKVNKTVAGP